MLPDRQRSLRAAAGGLAIFDAWLAAGLDVDVVLCGVGGARAGSDKVTAPCGGSAVDAAMMDD